jgi:hypothetical protein
MSGSEAIMYQPACVSASGTTLKTSGIKLVFNKILSNLRKIR